MAERLSEWKGQVYLVRDVRYSNGDRARTERGMLCEYATCDDDGRLSWHECYEGARYVDLEPLRRVDAGG